MFGFWGGGNGLTGGAIETKAGNERAAGTIANSPKVSSLIGVNLDVGPFLC